MTTPQMETCNGLGVLCVPWAAFGALGTFYFVILEASTKNFKGKRAPVIDPPRAYTATNKLVA